MKSKVSKWVDIIIASINFIIITYALSSMAMSFRTEFVYILFFASNVWVISRYSKAVAEKTGSKLISGIASLCCLLIFCAIAYSCGYIKGTLVPFNT